MASDPKWYDDSDVLLTAAPTLSGDAGSASDPVTLRLYNDKDEDGADTLPASRVFGLARLSSSATAVSSGLPLVDRRMVEARITQGLGGLSAPASAWHELGDGAWLPVPSLASGEGVEIEFRLDAPQDAQGANLTFVLQLSVSASTSLGSGHSEIAGDGIYLGIGDPRVTVLVDGEGVVENPAAADDEVQVGPFVWIAEGVPYSYPAQLVALAASAASNARYVLLSLATDGTLTDTDGTETTDPLDDDDKPETPSGEIAIAYVQVDDSGVITDAEIEQVYQLGLYAVADSGLNVTVGPGRALVDNALTFNQASQAASLTASETNHLWMQRSGSLEVTIDGAPPAGTNPLLLAILTTDGSGVTAFEDRRRYIGFRIHRVTFEWLGTLTTADYRYAVSPSDRPAYLLPIKGMRAAVAGTGTTSGVTSFEVEVDDAHDDTWATTLTDSAAPPSIAFDATDQRSLDAVPADFAIPPGVRIRAQVDAVPGGADSEDAVLELLVVEV